MGYSIMYIMKGNYMNQSKYLTIGALTKYLKYKFDHDEHLQKVYLKGEISNFKEHQTGHMYFSLKDEQSKINAIMFASNAKKLNFHPKNGDKVLVTGRVTVYEITGSYQIYVEDMEEDGIGNLYIAFEKLKKELAKEGLFDQKYKKPIPKIPTKIGIITAPVGAAIKDILSTIHRRFPLCETYLFPCLVQGEFAKEDIAKKIKQADQFHLDCLIVGRGGGSIEDLWPFNEEIVARAIFACQTPIVSAVGHEIDFTIADFVADLRAPTPTGAAEMVVPNRLDLQKMLYQYQIRLQESILKKIHIQKIKLDTLANSFVLKNPSFQYETKKQYIDTLMETLRKDISYRLDMTKNKWDHIKESVIFKTPEVLYQKSQEQLKTALVKLHLLNPLNVLERGYAIPYMENKIITNLQEVKKGDLVSFQMQEGKILSKVVEVKEETYDETRTNL